jgi:hypothetical protein
VTVVQYESYRRDDQGPVIAEIEREDPGAGGIEETQASAISGPDVEPGRQRAVDRHRIADATGHCHFHAAAEVADDLGVASEAPVAEHPGHVAVDGGGLALLHDQRPVEAAADLLEAALVRVVPVAAGVRHVELLDEALARSDALVPGQVAAGVRALSVMSDLLDKIGIDAFFDGQREHLSRGLIAANENLPGDRGTPAFMLQGELSARRRRGEDLVSLEAAHAMERAGRTTVEITQATGWFRDDAGAWAREFSDEALRLTAGRAAALKGGQRAPGATAGAGALFSHPEL